MRHFLILLFPLFLSLSFLTTIAAAQDDFSAGKQLFDKGRYAEALRSLEKALAENPDNLDISFYMGRSAFALMDYEAAIMAYDRILIMDPNAVRVKLEIGRSYMQLGSKEHARRYFQEVLETKPPEVVRQNIEILLAQMAASEKRHFFSGMLSVGASLDDNIRVSPTSPLIQTVSGETTLTGDTAAPQDDWLASVTASLLHTYILSNTSLAWQTEGILYNGFYEVEHDLDVNYIGLSSGLAWKREKTLWKNQVSGKYLQLGYDRYMGSMGFESLLTLALLRSLSITLTAQVEDKNYYTLPEKNGINAKLSLAPSLIVGKNRFSFGVSHEWENAEEPYNDYHKLTLQAGYGRILPADISFFSSYRYQKAEYKKAEQLFPDPRTEEVHDVSGGLSMELWQSENKAYRLLARISHTYTESKSNVDLYDYRKNVSALTLSYLF